MKLKTLVLPSLALGAAAMLMIPPPESHGFSTIGGSLSQTQRDFRTFTNWSDPDADDNMIPEPQFPGHFGTTLAIWKACIEWGSMAHGDGSGDPLQSTLGSGGANFDPSFQQQASGVGGTNDNIHSQISGGAGGVLAFTETPISNGWRIRYYQNWQWEDGPGSPSFSEIDIQGVATHEYGHALGLGHSTVGGSTMFPSISGTGTVTRSIENDDINGVKFVYGTASASKPVINGVSVSGGNVTVSGSNFSATNNQVWFTNASITGGTSPIIKVLNVPSSAGQITVAIPGSAGPGDIQVRNNGTGHSNLSNAFPFDVAGGGGGVTISSIVPSSIGAVNPGSAQIVTINGSGFTSSAEVYIDGQLLVGIPSPVTFVDSGTLTFDPPLVDQLGAVEVRVEVGVQSATSSITYVANDPPACEAGTGDEPVTVVSFSGVDVTVGIPANKNFILGMSSTLAPSVHPNVTIDIGAGFTDIVNLGVYNVGADGHHTIHVAPPYGAGTTFWFQAVWIDLVGGAPWPTTNTQECFLVF